MKKIILILLTNISFIYSQFTDSYKEKELTFTSHYVINKGLEEPIDSVMITYEKDIKVFTMFNQYNIGYIDDAITVWATFTQMMYDYPPYDLYDTVYVSNNKVSIFFER